MAVATIRHNPSLTKEQARAFFEKHFEGKYKVEDWKGPLIGMGRDFVIIKNAATGVAVKLEQSANETKLVYGGYAPKIWARVLFSAVASMLLWNGLTNEVKQFIESAPEFQCAAAAASG